MKNLRKNFIGFCATFIFAGTVVTPLTSMANNEFPGNNSIRLLVGFPAGTSTDLAARVLAAKLQNSMSIPVVVENRSGGAAFVAAQELSRAAPNGQTLLLGPMPTISIAPAINSKMKWNPLRDFEPVGIIADSDLIFVVNPKMTPVNTVAEYVEWGRTKKNSTFIGTLGAGTLGHLTGVLFAQSTNLKLESIHYRTTGEAFTGMINGDIHGLIVAPSIAAAHIKAGTLKALASTGKVRSASLPDVPTFNEVGYPALEFFLWYGIFAPTGTPEAVLNKINSELAAAAHDADVRKKLESSGFRAISIERDKFKKIVREDSQRWKIVVESAGLK